MKLITRGLVAASLLLAAMASSSSIALADPIGGPWTGSGSITLDGGLGGSTCTALSVAGARNGNSITSATFGGCTGVGGTPTALVPWSITWNGTNNGGTILLTDRKRIFGITLCLYQGGVSFTYDGSTKTVIAVETIPLIRGTFPCPSELTVRAIIVIVS
jgi:hypothetical protein